ncbi:hypothetical protein K469DRAFT_712418 [Zopfia rhizophila CBS 207.26]|uniref:Myb-like domain-containing protein n=1 Tax=Zopfia rhizophila CBS 207.26 TaxID=1314779 RepID=A0A6A6EQS4_9PEZI|nr:hypothetical protein K469DRAFT_712418 [Zopfia rhizophila CBS 207.26]
MLFDVDPGDYNEQEDFKCRGDPEPHIRSQKIIYHSGEVNGDDDFEDSGVNSGNRHSGDSDSDAEIDDDDDDDDNDDEPPHREHRRAHVRTREPWSKSDEQRLLAYKSKMDMKWNDIFCRFLNRTLGAVRACWHILQGKYRDEMD